jgi:6-phosphofructokinase 1
MIGIQNEQIVHVPFVKAIKNDKPLDPYLLNVLELVSK